MDLASLVARIGQKVPGSVLEQQRFGRTGVPCVWIEARKLLEVASFLRDDREAALKWLEQIGAAQIGEDIVLSYFVRSTRGREELVLRVALQLGASGVCLQAPSVRGIWPMAATMESELGELFGIRFGEFDGVSELVGREFKGFPLRKDAACPKF